MAGNLASAARIRSTRRELMRKLPEAGSQLIREFKKKDGALVAFRVAGLTPGDDPFERHPAGAETGMHVHH